MSHLKKFCDHIKAALSTYNFVVYLGDSRLGFIIFAATFLHPNIGISGCIGLLSALVFLYLLKIDHHLPARNLFLYNSLLVGLFIGYLFNLDLSVVCLISLSSCLTLLLTLFLDSLLTLLVLPVLSLPFTIVALLLALSAKGFSNLSDGTYYFMESTLPILDELPLILQEGLRSLGAIFCIPDPLFGAILLFAVLVHSPLTGLFLIVGYFSGFLAEKSLAFGEPVLFLKHHYFNYSLIFVAIAGVFVIPSRRSILLAFSGTLIAILLSTASSAFWAFFQVPMMVFPFNALVVLLFVRALRSVDPGQLNPFRSTSPESALEKARLLKLRHRGSEMSIFCPFEGEWTVQQGFNGQWTHRGNWRHALDLVVQENQKTFYDRGLELENYYSFGRPILSPVEGYVAATSSNHPDNRVGKVDNQNNWGNYIIIRSIAGFYVVLAHLKQGSLKVGTGDYVVVGKQIALCGNSGYSQEPHLHIQIQQTPQIGAYTLPFHLINYSIGNEIYFHKIPKVNDKITPLPLNVTLENILTFKVGQTMRWKKNDAKLGESCFTLTLKMDEVSGLLYWTDGKTRLHFSKLGTQFYFYGLEGKKSSPLYDLYLSAPRIPLTYGRPLKYRDDLPLIMIQGTIKRIFSSLIQVMTGRLIRSLAFYSFNPDHLEIRGHFFVNIRKVQTFFKVDPMTGIREFCVGERRYVRVD